MRIRRNIKKITAIGVSALCIGLLADYCKLLPYKKTIYGQVCSYTTTEEKFISLGLELKNGSELECNIRNWKETTYPCPATQEIWKDITCEKEKDLEKVTGYNWNGKFYMTELEINGKTFKFQ